jgi:dipeptidyl aminopeptidase/acylaminoacyl peptidase
MRVLKGHRSRVHALAFSPDGRRLASASGAGTTVRLWDLATGQSAQLLRGHPSAVAAVAFSPDSRRLATADVRSIVRLWDRDDAGRFLPQREPLPSNYFAPRALAFSPDGRLLVAGGLGLHTWDLESRSRIDGPSPEPPGFWRRLLRAVPLRLPQPPVLGLAFSPDGRWLAWSEPGARSVHRRDATTGRVERGWLPPLSTHAAALAYSADGARLAVVTGWGVTLFDSAGGKRLRELRGHRGLIWGLAWSPGGPTLATASNDQTVRFWDAPTGREVSRFTWGVGKVRSVAFAADGLTVAAGGYDGRIVLWDVDDG